MIDLQREREKYVWRFPVLFRHIKFEELEEDPWKISRGKSDAYILGNYKSTDPEEKSILSLSSLQGISTSVWGIKNEEAWHFLAQLYENTFYLSCHFESQDVDLIIISFSVLEMEKSWILTVSYDSRVFLSNICKHNQQKKYFFGEDKINGSISLDWAAENWLNYKMTTLVINKGKKKDEYIVKQSRNYISILRKIK